MDIVERLRNRGIPVQYGEFTDYLPDRDCIEAADEIERLREAYAILRNIVEYEDELASGSNRYELAIEWNKLIKSARSALQQKDSE